MLLCIVDPKALRKLALLVVRSTKKVIHLGENL